MAKGSQLTKLRLSLSDARLSRQSQANPSGRERKRSTNSASGDKDKDKAAKKLHAIRERLNPFDVKVTKLKHDVGGRKLKGVTGRPGLSKQAGIERRKKTLLAEYDQRHHAGGIIDRRFGENDPSMPPEERMLERFTRERQRPSKGVNFSLQEEDELTHYGQSLSAMDDFDGVGLDIEDDEEGHIDSRTVSKSHFGGFDEEENGDEERPPKKKSKAEVMTEVIAKSKEHKYQRQMEREEDQNARHQLDEEFDTIRNLLVKNGSDYGTGDISAPREISQVAPEEDMKVGGPGDEEYDKFVRELAFDKRSKPKDRTKTEEELALEEKEALEKAERARIRRMTGNEAESDEGENGENRKRKRSRGGDDLEDDFAEDAELNELGTGLDSDFGKHMDAKVKGGRSPEDSESEGPTSIEDGQSDGSEEHQGEDGGTMSLVSSLPRFERGKRSANRDELPFIFPCPDTHEEFLSIIEGIDDNDVPTIVQRIRSLHHPSLSGDNPAKLQALTSVLVDHILHITSPPSPRFSQLDRLLPHIYALAQAYSVAAAQTFVSKLVLMHKNLMHGLSNGATSMESKTWPGPAELGILRAIGVMWSTSDLNHAVVSPTRVLIGAYLSLCRIRSTADLASGLFLCTLILQYEEFSRRLVPEAINFLSNAVLHLAPHRLKRVESLPGSFPTPEFGSEVLSSLQVSGEIARFLEVFQPDLVQTLRGQDTTQIRVNLLGTTFQLLDNYASMYKDLDSFIEIYSPVLDVLKGLDLDQLPSVLQQRHLDLQDTLTRFLKFSGQSRCPLLLQAHKPVPIQSYVPKFSSTSSSYLRKQDPDHERAMAAKLRYQVKQERKGVIRELRKDAQFLAGVQQRRQAEEDKRYNERMKKVFSSIEGERAEQKALDRERARDKRRAARK